MTDREMAMKIASKLYQQVIKELKEKGFTEEVSNAINTLLELFKFVSYF